MEMLFQVSDGPGSPRPVMEALESEKGILYMCTVLYERLTSRAA
jgi:hypothetical protein